MSNPLDRRFFSICKYCQGLIPVRWNQHETRYEYEPHNYASDYLKGHSCFGAGTRHDSSPVGDKAPSDL